jgi:hypothetical protein
MIFINMKILIIESRRDQLAKKELDKAFSNMYEDVSYMTDSVGEQKKIEFRNGDGVIMLYGDRNKTLYICEDVVKPITYFSYTPPEVKRLVGKWFSEFFELPVEKVHHVNKHILN